MVANVYLGPNANKNTGLRIPICEVFRSFCGKREPARDLARPRGAALLMPPEREN